MNINMTALIVLTIFSTVCCTGLLGYVAGMARRLRELETLCDRRDGTIRNALASLADKTAKLADRQEEQNNALAEVKQKLDELPAEELREEYKRMNAWNDGVDSIVNFSPEVPKLNMGGIKHG